MQAGETSVLALKVGVTCPPRPSQKHQASPTSAMAVFAQNNLPVPILQPPALLFATPPPQAMLKAPCPPACAGEGWQGCGQQEQGSGLASPLLTARFFSMNGQTVG